MRDKSLISKYLILSIIILAVGIPTFPVFGGAEIVLSPVILSAVWDDADNGDEGLSTDDTLTITLDVATNRPGGTGTLAKGIVDNLFSFANGIGTDYTGVWTSTTVFTITIVDATGATASIGDTVSAKGTLVFTGVLDTAGGAAFSNPQDIATNSTDFIFVSDADPDIVQIFNPDGTYAGVDLSGTTFSNPVGIGTNSTDFIFVVDGLVHIFNPDGTFAGILDPPGGNPRDIAISSTDFIFVSDLTLAAIQIFNPDGTFAGALTGGTPFVFPLGIATNSTNFIFVADSVIDLVQIFNPDGTFAGTLDNTVGTPFPFPAAIGIATNSTDFIFVSDFVNNIVYIFNPDETLAGTVDTSGGTPFAFPIGIATNSKDDLFVVDSTANNVQRFSQGIRDSTSTSPPATSGVNTTGDFGVVPCTIETALNVDTIIFSSCTVTSSITAGGSVRVQSGAVMTISPTGTLNINFATKNLTVESGSGVLIQAGGSIT